MRVKYNMEEERKVGLKKGLDYMPRGLYVTSLVGGGSPVGLLNVGAWRATVKGTTGFGQRKFHTGRLQMTMLAS